MATPNNAEQQGAALLSFNPLPNELPYYDGLFNVADKHQLGILAGTEAVQFLSRSNIPTPTLKNIWNMADQEPKSNALDKKKFYVVLRLIQLFQNGQRPQGSNLIVAEESKMRAVQFEGISGVVVPFPSQIAPIHRTSTPGLTPPMQQPMPSLQPNKIEETTQRDHVTELTSANDQYAMFPHEQTRYEALFPNYEKLNDGYVYGAEAVALFSRSGLSKDQLRDIWNLADYPVDNRLDKVEFAIAMHLIVCISKKTLELPKVLPPSLQLLKKIRDGQLAPLQPSANVLSGRPENTPPNETQNSTSLPSVGYNQNLGQNQPSLSEHMEPGIKPLEPSYPGQTESYQAQMNGNSGNMNGNAQLGGMSISDAFSEISVVQPGSNQSEPLTENNNVSDPSADDNMALPSPPLQHQNYQQDIVPTQSFVAPAPPSLHEVSAFPSNTTNTIDQQDEVPVSITDNEHLVAQIPISEDGPELETMKKVLQQLQAENVSLKAKLSTMKEEEECVKEEVSKTVSEIGILSKELISIRSEVSMAKTSLIEATSELKIEKEKKGDIVENLNEAKKTLEVLNVAQNSVDEVKKMSEQKQEEVAASGQHFDVDFFDGFYQDPNMQKSKVEESPNEAYQNGPQVTPIYHPDSEEPSEHHHQNPTQPLNQTNARVFDGYQNNQMYMGGVSNLDTNAGIVQTQTPVQTPAVPLGGMPVPQMTNPVINPNSFSHVDNKQTAPPPSTDEISIMQQEARQAANIAFKAEQLQQFAVLRAEELQRNVSEAESSLREIELAMASKKSKGFGRGGKKAQKKEYETALENVADLKKSGSEAQSKITASQVNAMKAKREADQLRLKCEQAEFDVAAAASVKEMYGRNGNFSNTPGNINSTVQNGTSGLVTDSHQDIGFQNSVPPNSSQVDDNPFHNFEFSATSNTAGQF